MDGIIAFLVALFVLIIGIIIFGRGEPPKKEEKSKNISKEPKKNEVDESFKKIQNQFDSINNTVNGMKSNIEERTRNINNLKGSIDMLGNIHRRY